MTRGHTTWFLRWIVFVCCSVLGQMIWIWVWKSSLNADLHCESWITRLWGWGVFELLGACGTGETQVNSRKGECSVYTSGSEQLCQCRSSQGNLARNKQSKCRSHNPSSIIKENSLEGEEKRKGWGFCVPIEQDCRGLRELEESNWKDGDVGWNWITVICRRERHRLWKLRGFVKEQEVKNNFKRNDSLLNSEHWDFLHGSSDYPGLLSCYMDNSWFLLSFPYLLEERTAGLSPIAGIWNVHLSFTWNDLMTANPRYHKKGHEHPSSKQRLTGLSGSSVAALGIIQTSWNRVMEVFITQKLSACCEVSLKLEIIG